MRPDGVAMAGLLDAAGDPAGGGLDLLGGPPVRVFGCVAEGLVLRPDMQIGVDDVDPLEELQPPPDEFGDSAVTEIAVPGTDTDEQVLTAAPDLAAAVGERKGLVPGRIDGCGTFTREGFTHALPPLRRNGHRTGFRWFTRFYRGFTEVHDGSRSSPGVGGGVTAC